MISATKENFAGSIRSENLNLIKETAEKLNMEISFSNPELTNVFIYANGKDNCKLLWETFKQNYPNKN